MTNPLSDDQCDALADETIRTCLNLTQPKSFFLYAGAGSGKTRSLVTAIRDLLDRQGRQLTLAGQKIAIITYTNAACDEIKQRLEFDPRIDVSTIHSFAWSLISGYDGDIRQWLDTNLLEDIAKLEEEQKSGRAGSKAALERAQSIESKTRRRGALGEILRFIYSSTGDNRTRDALNHAEVIAMTATFLNNKAGLRRQLVARYPILLIDESQDTAKRLMDAFLGVQAAHAERFCLGLFGDTMQRIYADGKVGLAEAIPTNWERPRKIMNHRCSKRVVTLINNIRADDDAQEQKWRSNAPEGLVRLFLAAETLPKAVVEAKASSKMAELTGDEAWVAEHGAVKTLTLEHLMAVRRLGFQRFFEPLYGYEPMRTALLDGSGRGLGFFTRELLPLAQALASGNRFAIASSLRRSSPLLDRQRLTEAGEDQKELLTHAKAACDGLQAMLMASNPPSLRMVLRYTAKTDLFEIPDILQPFLPDHPEGAGDSEEDPKSEIGAWRMALDAPFSEIAKYDRYVRGVSQFDTHQGVKGLEFPRVMVIISDAEARGFLFSYEKLVGTKTKTKNDLDKEAAGGDTSIDRTRRLFYVTCSRAEESLAVVYYSDNPLVARTALLERGWFTEDEIEMLSA